MSRKLERILLYIGSGWNFVLSIITILGYSLWFRSAGSANIQANGKNVAFNSKLLDNVTTVIMVFGLAILVGALFNFYVARHVKDGVVQKKVMIWIAVWGILNLVSSDPIGFGIYLITFVIYFSRNKAIKMTNGVTE
ncbi:hypothetical protein [Lapidilactobacillus salsurivasis]